MFSVLVNRYLGPKKMLSDVNINQAIDKDLIIDPFDPELVNPIGYDLTIGDLVFSRDSGLLDERDGYYIVPPRSTVHILTRESIWLSGKIAGTLHPRVSNANLGLSHIATTVDPGWIGPLLVTISNLTDDQINLDSKRAFCTMLLHKLDTETKTVKRHFSFIQRTLVSQIKEREDEYVKKVEQIIEAQYVEKMREQIEKSNGHLSLRIARRLRVNQLKRMAVSAFRFFLGVMAFTIAAVPAYWDKINHYFHGVDYDTTVLVGQVTVIIAILALLKRTP